MIRQWIILGLLTVIILCVIFQFYIEAVNYNPIGDFEGTEAILKDKTKSSNVFKPAWGKEIVERNLFSPWRGRRPPPPPPPRPAVQTQPVIPKKPDLTLNGIILGPLGEYVAYLQLNGTETVELKKGDTVGDIRIIDVRERTVELLWNDETIELNMEKTRIP